MTRNYTRGYVAKDRESEAQLSGIRRSANAKDNRNKSHTETFLREWRDELVLEDAHDEGDRVQGTSEACYRTEDSGSH